MGQTRSRTGSLLGSSMSHLLLWCFALFVIFTAASVFGQDDLAPDKPLPNSDVRRALAKKLSIVFLQLDRQIPRLSPNQQDWLKSEYHDQIAAAGNRYTQRAIAATKSKEYQISIAKARTKELSTVLSRIASGEAQTKAGEMALWAAAANLLIDYEYWQAIGDLVDSKAIQPRIGHVDSYYFQNYVLQAQRIFSRIIVPYIDGRLP
jgi:hypothetical protein